MPANRLEVQVFGVRKDADTRKALRFFSERRVKTHFVDLAVRAASYGELWRFAQKFGAEHLIERRSPRFQELGLQQAILSDERWIQRLADEPALLRIPLVRNGSLLTVGAAEEIWKDWIR
jgi:arsenate reductase